MVVIKRFHDCLLPTHDAVVAKNKQLTQIGMAVKDPFLLKTSGYKFYNTSEYTFDIQERQNKIYDAIATAEADIAEVQTRLTNLRKQQISSDNVYQFLLYFTYLQTFLHRLVKSIHHYDYLSVHTFFLRFDGLLYIRKLKRCSYKR